MFEQKCIGSAENSKSFTPEECPYIHPGHGFVSLDDFVRKERVEFLEGLTREGVRKEHGMLIGKQRILNVIPLGDLESAFQSPFLGDTY